MTSLKSRFNKILFEIKKLKDYSKVWPIGVVPYLIDKPITVNIMSLKAGKVLKGITCTNSTMSSILLFNPEEASNDQDTWSEEFLEKDYLKTWYLCGEIVVRGSHSFYDKTYFPSDLDSNGKLKLL